MADLSDYLAFGITLAEEAGTTIRHAYRQRHGWHSVHSTGSMTDTANDNNGYGQATCDNNDDTKAGNPSDLVTVTDRAVEARLRERIAERYPTHRCVGEEFDQGPVDLGGAEPIWIMDPIDGTANFVHGFPFVAVSIGIVLNGELVVGIVYNPILDELYTAVQGQGAYLHRTVPLPLHARPVQDLRSCMVGVEYGAVRDDSTLLPKVRSMQRLAAATGGHCRGVRCTGSAALNLCLVARGSMDVYWEQGIHCWDVAAGALIVRESGGCVVSGAGWYQNDGDRALQQQPELAPFDLLDRKVLAVRGSPTASSARLIAAELLSLVEDITLERD